MLLQLSAISLTVVFQHGLFQAILIVPLLVLAARQRMTKTLTD